MPTPGGIGRIKESQVYSTPQNNQPDVNLIQNANEEVNPISVPEFFYETVKKFGKNAALISNKAESGNSQLVTYKEYYQKVIHVAKAFIKMGMEVKHSVAVLASNCPEWCYSELGAIHAGGIIVGIYPTSSTEIIRYILESSKANIIVVDGSDKMEKVRQIRNSLPLLKAAIQINGPFGGYMQMEKGYYKWADIELLDVSDCEYELNARLKNIGINECAALIYTSGTTGMPKGVMLTHDNLIFSAKRNVERFLQLQVGCERIVSYLPMSHIAAQLIDIFISIELAATVYFADSNALKGSLINTLREARPTFFGGVPRIFEKFQERVISNEADISFMKKIVISWSRKKMLQHHLSTVQGCYSESFQHQIATNFVGQSIRASLGLDQTKVFIAGGAAVAPEMKKYFMSLGIYLTELYGCSELTGMICYACPDSTNINAVGKPLNEIELKILHPDEKGQGEVCVRGRCTFIGYLEDEERTREVLKEDGWFFTGDVGRLDSKGDLYIVGRIKEMVITSGGENIPAIRIENLVKAELPILSNAFLVGDRRKYLTMLVTLKTNMDTETGRPLDILEEQTVKYLKQHGLNYKTLSEILEAGPCPKVMQLIQNGIDSANLNAFSNAQKVQKFALLSHDFSIPTNELSLTLKVKRHVVCSIYEDVINSLYK